MRQMLVAIMFFIGSGCASAFHWQTETAAMPSRSIKTKLNCSFIRGMRTTDLSFYLNTRQTAKYVNLQSKLESGFEADTKTNLSREYLEDLCRSQYGQNPDLSWVEVI